MLLGVDACVSLCRLILCISGVCVHVCVDIVPEESQCNFSCECACSVSACSFGLENL